MGFTFSVKQVRKGKWHHINLAQVAGKTWREVLAEFENTEAVAEFVFDDEKIYFCGTDPWVERMSQKGRAMRFAMVHDMLIDKDQRSWLDEKLPYIDPLVAFFGGEVEDQRFGDKVSEVGGA